MIGTSTQDRTHDDSTFFRNELVVFDEYREMLIKNFTSKDINQVSWAFACKEALGPDGYRSQFFLKYRECYRRRCHNPSSGVFRNREMLKGVNLTITTVISKCSHAELVGE